jgi:uncharacterized membrane-anchored protein YhcB (DUF1043 family)
MKYAIGIAIIVLAVIGALATQYHTETVSRLESEVNTVSARADEARAETTEITRQHETQLEEVTVRVDDASELAQSAAKKSKNALATAKEAHTVAEAKAAEAKAEAAQERVAEAQTTVASCSSLLAYAADHPGWVPSDADRGRCSQEGYAE